MQQFSQKYTIIHFFEPLADGTEFASIDWPPHVTLAETFAIHRNVVTLVDAMSQIAKIHKPVYTTALGDARFGPAHDIPVVLIDMPPTLITLHSDIITTLKHSCEAVFNHPHYIEDGYQAHSTIRPDARLHRDDRVTINSLSIVDMFPNNDPYKRRVVKTLRLSD